VTCDGVMLPADPRPGHPMRPLPLLLLLACTADPPVQPDLPAEPELTESDPSESDPPEPTWATLTDDQRHAYMTEVVLPAFTTILQAYDPVEFDVVTCVTCHGEDALAVDYRMPNSPYALPESGQPYSDSEDPVRAAWGAFMEDTVTPQMARLLDLPVENTPDTPGLGCYDCHRHAP
jgi:hypothetical protein